MYSQKILSEFQLKIKIAGEIEFYLTPALVSEEVENNFQEKVLYTLKQNPIKVPSPSTGEGQGEGESSYPHHPNLLPQGEKENAISLWSFQNEVAPSQYEVALQPKEPKIAIHELIKLKEIISETAKTFGVEALFKAKPYENLPGCGLHIHIGIDDNDGNSMLTRIGEFGNRESESEVMLHAIGGLCSTMLKNFIYFAPHEESYLRFSAKRNELENIAIAAAEAPANSAPNPLATYNNAPTNVSWGGNNRTTAIRIPVSTIDETARHIEHRVAGADADPAEVINAILEGIYTGLKNKIIPPEKIYGNAFDKQYDFLQPFPKTLDEARKFL